MIDNQRGQPLDSSRWGAVRTPILALAGGKSPAWIRAGMVALAESVSNARYQTLEGQTHVVKAKALAPVLSEFYSGATREDRPQTIAPAGKAIA